MSLVDVVVVVGCSLLRLQWQWRLACVGFAFLLLVVREEDGCEALAVCSFALVVCCLLLVMPSAGRMK